MYENVKNAGAQGLVSAGMDAKQIQPIVNQVDTLEKNLCRMQEVLQALEGRLSLVTRPLVDEPCKQPSDIVNCSPMTQSLIRLNTMIERQIVQVSVLHDSLEI